MSRSDGGMTERQKARLKSARTLKNASRQAGDGGIPTGDYSAPRKGYAAMLRPDYEFELDANELDPTEIIEQSGCGGITEEI